jgi:hypothetical protein
MKPQKEIIVNEILSEMDFGSGFSDCKKINGEKWRLAEKTFERYWNEAKKRYLEANERDKIALEGVRLEMKKEAVKSNILTKQERLDILSQIARGEIPMVKHIVVSMGSGLGSEIQERTIYPAWKDRKEAVAEINKMEGDYAPIKKDITSNGESLVPAPVFQIILDETDDDE